MRFSEVDTALQHWASAHSLHVAMRYRNEEVRSVSIVDDFGSEYQIFLTIQDTADQLRVTAVRPRRHRADFDTDLRMLPATLEEAYAVAEGWISAAGHSRTPVL